MKKSTANIRKIMKPNLLKIWNSVKSIFPYALSFALLLLLLNQCDRRAEDQRQSDSIERFLNDSVKYFQNRLGKVVSEKSALEGDNKTLDILLSKQIDSTGQLKELLKQYKSIAAAGNITQETKIDTIFIPFPEPVDYEFEKAWSLINPNYKIIGLTNQFGTQINSLIIPNTLSFAIGEKKSGFFRREFVINAVNSNPNIINTGLDSYVHTEIIKRFGIGPHIGYDPFTGRANFSIGLTYSIIRF